MQIWINSGWISKELRVHHSINLIYNITLMQLHSSVFDSFGQKTDDATISHLSSIYLSTIHMSNYSYWSVKLM